MSDLIPEWLPDWENPSKHPVPASGNEWAWEFLRRNVDYQDAYSGYLDLLGKLKDQNKDLRHLLKAPRAKSYETSIQFLLEDPVALTFLKITYEISQYCSPIQDKFRVFSGSILPDPSKNYDKAKPFFRTSSLVRVYAPKARMMLHVEGGMVESRTDMFFCKKDLIWLQHNEEEKITGIFKRPSEIIFSIDLSHNYENQIITINKILEREKKVLQKFGLGKRITKHDDFNPDMLQVHDSKRRKIKTVDIARSLYPHKFKKDQQAAEDSVKDLYKRSKKYVSKDYLKLSSQ